MQLKLLCSLIVLAIAQPAAHSQPQSPANPGVAAAQSPTSPEYQSAFSDYKPYKEPVVMSWREANDQVRDTGGMKGHDMATMKSQTDDPHGGHDMSSMGAKPSAGIPAGSAIAPAAQKAGQDHAAHGASKAPTEDPHAGHDMSKMTPAAGARQSVPTKAKKATAEHAAHGEKKAQTDDPHAGHDMSKMTPAKPAAAARPKAGERSAAKVTNPAPRAKQVPATDQHAGHDMSKMSAPPTQPNNKKEKE